jgi:hypothetical protein
MLSAPPVLSRITAIIAPRMMRIPIEAVVAPKPSLMILRISFPGKAVMARNKETINRETKALSLNFEVSRMMAVMLTNTRREMTATDMIIPGVDPYF